MRDARDRARRWTRRIVALLQEAPAISAALGERESNCYLWAVAKVAQEGGTIRLSPSAYGPWLHAAWQAPDGAVYEFAPEEELRARVLLDGPSAPPSLYPGAQTRIA